MELLIAKNDRFQLSMASFKKSLEATELESLANISSLSQFLFVLFYILCKFVFLAFRFLDSMAALSAYFAW